MRVLRKVTDDALSDGAVIKVHSSGAIDVAYDVDGSVGLSLTKEKDIFQLVGEDGKLKEKEKPIVKKKAKVSAWVCVGGALRYYAGGCRVCMHVYILRTLCCRCGPSCYAFIIFSRHFF